MIREKKAQLEATFNWIYVLIAGAVILLFFIGIVVKQKASSEESLAIDLVQTMGSIFNAAGVAEKTKNVVDISGLSDYTLSFSCEKGLGKFGIKGRSASIDNSIDPVFAPAEISSTRLYIWSLPYRLPYKAIDFLMVTSENTKYYLVGNDLVFIAEFMNSTNEFNREHLSDPAKAVPEENFQIRFIDTDDSAVKNSLVPEKLRSMDDDKVTAVSFSGDQANYFQKSGDTWKQLNPKPVRIISVEGEKDAAKYAAIFASDAENYQCNMKKAFLRLGYVAEVYAGKVKEIAGHYQSLGKKDYCFSSYSETGDVLTVMETHQQRISSCNFDYNLCPELAVSAAALAQANDGLENNNCLTVY